MAEISGLDQEALKAALVQLVGSDLVMVRGTAPDATYTFKHGLVQDAARVLEIWSDPTTDPYPSAGIKGAAGAYGGPVPPAE